MCDYDQITSHPPTFPSHSYSSQTSRLVRLELNLDTASTCNLHPIYLSYKNLHNIEQNVAKKKVC